MSMPLYSTLVSLSLMTALGGALTWSGLPFSGQPSTTVADGQIQANHRDGLLTAPFDSTKPRVKHEDDKPPAAEKGKGKKDDKADDIPLAEVPDNYRGPGPVAL